MKSASLALQKLRHTGLKITPQRMAILEILEGNTRHPSANMLYGDVKKKFPMISFATVYKTLKVLEEVGEIQGLTIADNKVNFDPNTEPHHHFLCSQCGRIIDVAPGVDSQLCDLEGHVVEKYQIYYYGICLKCHNLH